MNNIETVSCAIGRAALVVGGLSALGVAIGLPAETAKAVVWAWKNRDAVPIEHCAAVEAAAAGAVTRRDLRPDDWWRIWPELVTAEHPAPAVEARVSA